MDMLKSSVMCFKFVENLPVSLKLCLSDAKVGLSSAIFVFSNDFNTGVSFDDNLPLILAEGDYVSVKKL